METYRFKTTLKCSGCVAKLKPHLDKLQVEWNVDLSSPEKTITVTTGLPAAEIKAAIEAAGFKAEQL